MIDIYLFDWGDTLMVDLPDKQGKMCDWDIIEAVSGAEETLAFLSKESKIYIAQVQLNLLNQILKKHLIELGLANTFQVTFVSLTWGYLKALPSFIKQSYQR